MHRVVETKNVPADAVDNLVAALRQSGAIDIKKIAQDDGTFTVSATILPGDPAGVPTDPE